MRSGDIRGAVRAIPSDIKLTPFTEETANLLDEKRPSDREQSHTLEAAIIQVHEVELLSVSENEVLNATCSFLAGSSAGRNGSTPDHLKDLTSRSAARTRELPLSRSTRVCN